MSADTLPLHCSLQVGRNDFLYVSANVINHQSLVAAHVRLGVLTARSRSDSRWAAQRDECLANTGSWARRWQCAALMHARCAEIHLLSLRGLIWLHCNVRSLATHSAGSGSKSFQGSSGWSLS